MNPIRPDAYRLFHEGSLAFSEMETNGLRIDMKHLQNSVKMVKRKIKRLTQRLRDDDLFKLWRKFYGQKLNLGSRPQLGRILYKTMGYPITDFTKTGRPQVDENSLKKIDLPILKDLLRMEKYKKLQSTYLNGLLKGTVNGFLHPDFNLHTTKTFRSSSSNPNFQNIPVRNLEIGEIIRKCFIPRDDHLLVESDCKGLEVSISACHNQDPQLIRYIKDPTTDMHRDMASQIFMVEPEQVSKIMRYWGKSGFVFPEFYGDYYIHCAIAMWNAMVKQEFTTTDGMNVQAILQDRGIIKLGKCDPTQTPKKGTFEKHMKEVEEDFWNRRFKIYSRWKKQQWRQYEARGYFDMKTGFRVSGILDRKQVSNYPIQGAAFHCLLWTLIELNKWLKRRKMRTKIIGQIHDSILSDVHKNELDDYIIMIRRIACKKLPRAWTWINVPLKIDIEVSPLGKSWHEKKEI